MAGHSSNPLSVQGIIKIIETAGQYGADQGTLSKLHAALRGDPPIPVTTSEAELISRAILKIKDPGTQHGIQFRSVSDLCQQPPSQHWLVKDRFEKNTLASIYSPSGVGKTFFVVGVASSVASGRDWHSHQVEKGPVFIIIGEGGAGMGRRLKAWALFHHVDLEGLPLYVSNQATQLLDKNATEELLRAIDELASVHGKPVLIVIDTLARNFGAGDENSTADMSRAVGATDELRARYGCTVLLVHHTGLTATDRARGASALRAALDWEYSLSKNADGTRILVCTKAKDFVEPDPMAFELKTITLDDWRDEDGQSMTSCVLVRSNSPATHIKQLTGARKVAFDALLSTGLYVHIDAWRDAAYSAGISPSSSRDAKQKAFKRAVSDLRDMGYVQTKDDVWWPVTYECRTIE